MIKKNIIKIAVVVLLDLAVFAVLLLGFAWFHHARPREVPKPRPIGFTTPAPDDTAAPVTVAPTQSAGETPAPGSSESPADVTETPTAAPTETPTGLLGAKFAEKFTDGEVIYTDSCYRSKNVCVEVAEYEMKVRGWPVHYFVADIYIRDITSFRCEVADYAPNNSDKVVNMANRNNAIVALSGDWFLNHANGLAIRNGMVYRENLHRDQDVCVLYMDGTMETYLKGEVDLNYIYSKNPYHAWSFGPRLVEKGEIPTEFNTSVGSWNPRSAVGYYEPGHYCFVTVDGRQEGYSYGLLMEDLAKLMYDLGCTTAYNLDGGMTAMMAYKGELYSRPCGGGRQNTDILYIAEPLGQ